MSVISTSVGHTFQVQSVHLPPSVRPNGEVDQNCAQMGIERLGNGLGTNQGPAVVPGQPALQLPGTGVVSSGSFLDCSTVITV